MRFTLSPQCWCLPIPSIPVHQPSHRLSARRNTAAATAIAWELKPCFFTINTMRGGFQVPFCPVIQCWEANHENEIDPRKGEPLSIFELWLVGFIKGVSTIYFWRVHLWGAG